MAEAPHRLPAGAPRRSAGELAGSHDGAGVRLGIACARFNEEVTRRLLDGARAALDEHKVDPADRALLWVPGAFELPLAAKALLGTGNFDGVVCLGAVVRGETSHYDFVAGQCAAGLQRVQLDTGRPVVFGVLTTENLDQALERSGGRLGDKGAEAVLTAIEMVRLLAAVTEPGSRPEAAGRHGRDRLGRRAAGRQA